MDWGEQKLSLLCDMFTDGDWVESKDQSAEGIRLIQTGNVGEGVFKNRRDKSRFISEDTFNRLKCTEIIEGDCLVSRLPDPVGRSCLIPNTGDRMITAVDCTIIRLNKSRLLPEFFTYFTQSYSYLNTVESLTSGATRTRISRKNLGEVPIPLPPIPEQQRIVAILDQAFADIEKARVNAEKNLKNARELFDSYLNQVFSQRSEGWKKFNLGDIAEVSSGGTPVKSTKDYWNGSIPWYSSGELNKLFTKLSKEMITEKGLKESNAKLFPKGSLLIGMYDTAALKMSILDRVGCFNQAIAGVKPNHKVSLVFIYHTINFLKPELLLLRRGVRQKNLNQSKIKGIPIRLPSVEEQNAVVLLLHSLKDQSDKLADIYTQKLASLDELKKSLLQKAFSGELTKTEGQAA